MSYSFIEVVRSSEFAAWIDALADPRGRARILSRLKRVLAGHLGDWKPLGDGICEMRVDSGPGYRIYFARCGNRVVLLLCAGDKASQRSDIERARRIRQEYPWQ